MESVIGTKGPFSVCVFVDILEVKHQVKRNKDYPKLLPKPRQ